MKMNSKPRQKLKLYLVLKVYQKDGTVVIIRKKRKRAFRYAIEAVSGRKYDLSVSYGHGIAKNEGIYKKKKDLLHAYNCFTNKSDLKFIAEYNNLELPSKI